MQELAINLVTYATPMVILGICINGFRRNHNNIFLAASLFCLWYGLMMTRLVIYREVFEFPVLIRTGNLFAYFIYPLLFLYVRNTFYPGPLWRGWDILFFLPGAIYLVDYIPFFLLPSERKIEIFRVVLSDRAKLQATAEGWFKVPYYHFIMRFLYSFVLLGMIVRLIWLNRNNRVARPSSGPNKPLFFIIWMNLLYLPALFPGIIGVLFGADWYNEYFLVFSLSFALLGIILYIMVQPEVLSGYLLSLVPGNQEVPKVKMPTPDLPVDQSSFPDGQQGIASAIIAHMVGSKPFTRTGYSIHQMSAEVEIPVYQLSHVINSQFGMNFNSWVNGYRVDHFLQLASREDKRNLTMEALAMESGFSNRITFFKAFRKVKGQSPSEYLRSVRLTSEE